MRNPDMILQWSELARFDFGSLAAINFMTLSLNLSGQIPLVQNDGDNTK